MRRSRSPADTPSTQGKELDLTFDICVALEKKTLWKSERQHQGLVQKTQSWGHDQTQSSEQRSRRVKRHTQKKSDETVPGLKDVAFFPMKALHRLLSSIALETRAVHSRWLDLGGFKVAAAALQTCLGRLEIESQLRRAVHGKSYASEPQCTTKAGIQRLPLMCKNQKYYQSGKNGGVEFLRQMAHQTLSRRGRIYMCSVTVAFAMQVVVHADRFLRILSLRFFCMGSLRVCVLVSNLWLLSRCMLLVCQSQDVQVSLLS